MPNVLLEVENCSTSKARWRTSPRAFQPEGRTARCIASTSSNEQSGPSPLREACGKIGRWSMNSGNPSSLVSCSHRRRARGDRRFGCPSGRSLEGRARGTWRQRDRLVSAGGGTSQRSPRQSTLDAAPAWWPEFFANSRLDSVREVVLHVITETACHAGHLDAVRELIDGKQWLDLTE